MRRKQKGLFTHMVHSVNDAGHHCLTPHRGLKRAEREHARRVMYTDHVEIRIWSLKPVVLDLPNTGATVTGYQWQPG